MSATIVRAVRAAASSAGDVSGNCDAAAHYADRGDFEQAARELGWAEENLRSATHRIAEARAAVAKATGVSTETAERDTRTKDMFGGGA
ncbi:hypothetical protein [Roseateles terrae]|uniref:Cellobiose-specific phosphotransferase system component IIA n=1 Tax=Roseateles terrae TaxID=431060 RepID=A0ABR6GPE4_9BURK|nr:hypothetical protein [Roseateles terrae]MBB3193982.1 cellobiose-specific phosphotransferase system component IIA [Roseateles terrae]OWQ87856.1 hypothetical protein CDN98_06735 [Roseateles terrae]